MSVVNLMRIRSSIRSFWADRLKGVKKATIDEFDDNLLVKCSYLIGAHRKF